MALAYFLTGVAAVTSAALAAQPGEPPEGSTPEIELATYCAAAETHLSTLLAGSSTPNPAMVEKLKRSSVRWLKHADSKVDTSTPEGRVLVMDRYLAQSEAMSTARYKGDMEAAQIRELLRQDMAMCEKAAKDTFGSSFRDL